MDESMSEYISSTDELLVDDPDDPEWPETAAAYDVTIDEKRDEVVIDSRKDDFTGRVIRLISEDDSDPSEYYDEIAGALVSMRSFQADSGDLIEMRTETFPDGAWSVPLDLEYFYDFKDKATGARITTEISGRRYGSEIAQTESSPIDAVSRLLDIQLRHLRESIWEDFVVDNVTLNED